MKRLIAAIVLVVGLAGIAIAAAPFIAATDFAKRRIASQIAEWTGHPVTFAGEPTVKLFPYLSLTIRNAQIGVADKAIETPFVTTDFLTCKLRLLPFLIGRVEVAEFQLVRPHFHFAIDRDGESNWRVAGGSTSEASGRSRDFGETRLGRFRVVGGRVTFTDERSGRNEELSGLNVTLSWRKAKEPVFGEGVFSWRKEPVEFNVAVRAPLELIAGGASPIRFALASSPLRVSFTGKAESTSVPRLEGMATATTPSVRRILAWIGAEAGEGAILGAGSLDGRLFWQEQKATFADARLELDGNSATGEVSFDTSQRRPRIEGHLEFDKLDLTAYVEAFRATFSGIEATPDTPVSLSPFDVVDADFEASARQVLFGDRRLGRSHAVITSGRGEINLTVDDTRLYGGNLSGTTRILAGKQGLTAKSDFKVTKARAVSLLDALLGVDTVGGTLSADINFSAEGGTIDELSNSAAGSGVLTITDGAFSGTDLGEIAALSGAVGMADPDPAGDRLRFASVDADFSLAKSVLSSDNISVRGTGFAFDLAGKAYLMTSFVRARGMLTLDAIAAGKDVPFVIGGRWDRPVFLPDYERLIQRSSDGADSLPRDDTETAAPRG